MIRVEVNKYRASLVNALLALSLWSQVIVTFRRFGTIFLRYK